jgi:hypothetical protein
MAKLLGRRVSHVASSDSIIAAINEEGVRIFLYRN